MFELIFYTLPNGTKPVEKFINELPVKMQIKAVNSLELLEEFGNKLREPYSKSLGDGLFELRIKFASDISRIFYFFVVDNKIVVTNGFIKKTNRTPPGEIDKAKKYKADYERRNSHE